MINPTFVHLKEFQVIGISTRTSNALEAGGHGSIPKLWESFYQQQISRKVPNPMPDSPTFEVYTDYENGVTGAYNVLIGLKAADTADVPAGLAATSIPAGTYAIFTTEKGPIFQNVPACWAAIWEFVEQGGIERAYTGDFELYDERASNPQEAVVDIYIAVK
ncbi:GyrI-like domain-containing protein [Paenibacillus sp. GCM10027628]|uniref:GyrI-like domain-containing protein n=1 Tax=Paenibacillus sp. GCM10027628 TaxID=3273413 RepID=UPI003642A959